MVSRGSRIFGRGFNKFTTHPNQPALLKPDGKTVRTQLHAEIDACFDTPREKLSGSTVYVARTRKNGTLGNARPCGTCRRVMTQLGVSAIVYTTGNADYFLKEGLQ